MIFAAGRGSRLGALCRDRPKPLIPLGGRTMLERVLDLVAEAEIPRIAVNTHYLGDQIATLLAPRPDISVIPESPIALETGGGMKNALPVLGLDPVFTLNPDALWGGPNPLVALKRAWHPGKMGALLMLVPLARATAHKGRGDFSLYPDGRLQRHHGEPAAAYVNTGAQIIWPEISQFIDKERFSMNVLWDILIEERRLFGIIHPGTWVDTGTPEGIAAAERILRGPGHV